ncbi:PRC-barrel domain-containing protein [Prochlorococcus sp. MIT 0801]|uniref:PRC-barrel domain-containing protein n=1 Tax=Prochlorococcus sp. MIT 0801 TaxID=1501269 RepID=UPI0004F64D6D|nr:PRC-barrel domain-containing protein [Prochlorococcus sp. MIT 0801]AIQ96095.1 RNA metabolism-related protein [Prochlorococcus sp. MIT 0801]
MAVPKKLLFSDLLKHNVRCESGIDHGPVISPWMHPPVHRLLGFITRPSNLRLDREVWRLDQLKGINQQEVFVKGPCSVSDEQTLDRFPTLMNANVFNRSGQRIGLIADFLFELKKGNIQYYLVSRSNPFIPGTSRWRLNIAQIIDKQPGSISCDIDTFEDLPIQKASLKEEFLSKSRKWKTQFQDLTHNASDKLEGWIDDQISESDNDFVNNSYEILNDDASYDDWIDNLDIDSAEEFNRMNKRKKNTNSTNERDLDPWI